MKLIFVSLLTTLFHSLFQVHAAHVAVRNIGENAVIKDNGVTWVGEDGFQDGFTCPDSYFLSPSTDKKFASCCLKGQTLKGTSTTAFDCCAEGHDLAGSEAVGYTCCPTGQTYDGKICTNENAPVGSKCACTKDQDQTVTTEAGCCEPDECSSGLKTGKNELFMSLSMDIVSLPNLRCQKGNAIPSLRKMVNF